MVELYLRTFLALWLIAGLAAFFAVTFFWRRLGHRLPDAAGGIAIALARATAAFSAIQIRSRDIGQGWLITQRLAILSWLLWEVTGTCAAWRLKRKKAADEAANGVLNGRIRELTRVVDRAESEGLFRARLLAALRFAVHDKRVRIGDQLGPLPVGTRASIPRARDALNPSLQAYLLLGQMGAFLKELLPNAQQSLDQNFRVGLYVAQGGLLQPDMSADVLRRGRANFRSFKMHPERFRLDNFDNPCYAVRCIQKADLLIVPDGEREPDFYLHDSQRDYLKSLIAYPIIPYGREESDGVAAIVIDTNVVGHFVQDDRPTWKAFVEEFAARLNLEILLQELLG